MTSPKITAFMMTSNGRRRSFRIGAFTVMVEPHEDDKAQEEFTRKLADVAAGLEPKPKYYSCGICDYFHPAGFDGDCRNDAARFDVYKLDIKHGTLGWEEVEVES